VSPTRGQVDIFNQHVHGQVEIFKMFTSLDKHVLFISMYHLYQCIYYMTVESRYLKIDDGTIFYKFKLPEVQINLHSSKAEFEISVFEISRFDCICCITGATLSVSSFDGSFKLSQLSACSHLVMFAAGTGFTPMVQLIYRSLVVDKQSSRYLT